MKNEFEKLGSFSQKTEKREGENKAARALRRLFYGGLLMSSILLNECKEPQLKNESLPIDKIGRVDQFQPIGKEKYIELRKIDNEIENLAEKLFVEIKDNKLASLDEDSVYHYKNWFFNAKQNDKISHSIDIGWSSTGKIGSTVREIYEYTIDLETPKERLKKYSSNQVAEDGYTPARSISHYFNSGLAKGNPNVKSYSYDFNKENGGSILEITSDNPQEGFKDIGANSTETYKKTLLLLNVFKNKILEELNTQTSK